MEQFNPDIRIVAIDRDDVSVTFDSAAAFDDRRAVKGVRIQRSFTEIDVTVDGFHDAPNSDNGEKKLFKGEIKLNVTGKEGTVRTLTLAMPELWIAANPKARREKGPATFPSAQAVQAMIRQGTASAFNRALTDYYQNEAVVDVASRMPTQTTGAEFNARQPQAMPGISHHAAPAATGFFPLRAAANGSNGSDTANHDARTHRRRLALAAVATPLLVVSLLWMGGAFAKKNDPYQDAVVKAMNQDPNAVQAHVELTKETLKQIGLDPGKAGDIGCLAAQ